MAIQGRPARSMFVGTSVSQPLLEPVREIISFYLVIDVPTGKNPFRELEYPITFRWLSSPASDAIPFAVSGFDEMDIEVENGTLSNFQAAGSSAIYTAIVTVADNTSDRCTITVLADVAAASNDSTSTGPDNPVSESFPFDTTDITIGIRNVSETCELERTIISNEYLNDVVIHMGSNAGGAFNGILEHVSDGDINYLVVQIEKLRQTVDEDGMLTNNNFIDNASQAGAVLFSLNMSTCVWTAIKAYKDITTAARSLEIKDGDLYFIEGSHYAYSPHAVFRNGSELSNDWKARIGRLFKYNPNSGLEDLGVNWRSATTGDNPNPVEDKPDYYYGIHGGTASPIVFKEDKIHMITGYGTFDGIERVGEFEVDNVDNWQWILYDDILNQRIPVLLTNEMTGYDILKFISTITNSIIGFDNDKLFIVPRLSRRAKLSTTLPSIATSFSIIDLSRETLWPDSGDIIIDGEIISYESIDQDDNEFTNFLRGSYKTTAVTHTVDLINNVNPDVYYVDHILSLDQRTLHAPINDVNINNDYRQLYNQVKVNYGNGKSVFLQDDDSVDRYGELMFEITAPIDSHQAVWADWIARSFLERFKDVKQIIDLKLKTTLYMKIGDVVVIQIPDRLHLTHACQVIGISQSIKERITDVKFVIL